MVEVLSCGYAAPSSSRLCVFIALRTRLRVPIQSPASPRPRSTLHTLDTLHVLVAAQPRRALGALCVMRRQAVSIRV